MSGGLTAMMIRHTWTDSDDELLLKMISECEPLFNYYKESNKGYTESNAWDAVAGRLLPLVCVTGAACKRRFARIKKQKSPDRSREKLIAKVEEFGEGSFQAACDQVPSLRRQIEDLDAKVEGLRERVDFLISLWK
jgi:hypothetical protein